jgi:hypothetical protein
MPFGSRSNRKVVIAKALIDEDIKEVQEEDMEKEEKEDMVVVEEDCITSLTMEKWATCHDSIPDHVHSMGTTILQIMS